ncbi:MAG TPA: manganese efflux pump MntP family protein [Kofleriaceae bacterium]|nr:manganese efflux pump MntP family protein [Kofleriaceae bacterium]
MDASAVTAARGANAPRVRTRDVVLVASLFGGLHLLMPLVGSLAGLRARALVERWDHWIAFVLLIAIGSKTTWSAWRSRRGAIGAFGPDVLDPLALAAVAVATSIDALAVGITLPLLDVSILGAAATIGAVTALTSIGGLFAGRQFGVRIGRWSSAFGGLVLIALGMKMLIEHLAMGR